MSDKWFAAMCWSSLLLGIFMIKQCVALNLIVLGFLKQNCYIKVSGILTPLPLKNNSVTIGLNFLLDFIFTINSLNTINTYLYFVGLWSSKFS